MEFTENQIELGQSILDFLMKHEEVSNLTSVTKRSKADLELLIGAFQYCAGTYKDEISDGMYS